MHCVRNITDKIFWIGVNDRRLELFENMFPLPKGVSYNSYLILDEKTAVVDTVDATQRKQFVDNIKYLLNGRQLDYLIINHMEPDHCGSIESVVELYPNVKLIGNRTTFTFFEQFYTSDKKANYQILGKDEVLDLGENKLHFVPAPMVHWPEVTVTYESTNKILFSADAFGTFGSINGNIFMDEIDFDHELLDEARRYYTNIVGKFGPQVQSLLKKASELEIKTICPLHGPVIRTSEDIAKMISLYNKWSTYTPEEKGIVIAFGSMYGNTENIADCIAHKLAINGVRNIKMYDVSKTHASYIIADMFKYSHMLIAAPTYNLGLYHGMECLLRELAALNFKDRKVAIVGNHTWASGALKTMRNIIENDFKNMEIIGETLDIKSSLKAEQESIIEELAQVISNSIKA